MDDLRAQVEQIKKRRQMRLHRAAPPPPPFFIDSSHYHILYTPLELEDTAIPDFTRAYRTKRSAYEILKAAGDASEPNTVWSEDGRVMIEMRLKDRTGLHRIMLEVVACRQMGCGTGSSYAGLLM